MARFLGGLNEEIADFVEMFPYHTLQDLVDQSMRTERKNSARDMWKILCKSFYYSPVAQAVVWHFFWWGTIPRCCS